MNLQPDHTSPIPARLTQLRHAMREQGLDAYLIPSSDPHLSEYLPARWQAREQFSGFTGSVGTLVVTASFAGLWVDSRYWAQAEIELAGSTIALMKIASAAATLHIDWLAEHLTAGQALGVDGTILGLASVRALQSALEPQHITLDTRHDLIDAAWSDRPGLLSATVFEHLAPFAVLSRKDKLLTLRQKMREQQADWHFIATVDDIAWLFNLRGSDVSYNPVFVAHALIGLETAILFVEAEKIPDNIASALANDGVTLSPYSEAIARLGSLPEKAVLLLDPRRVTYAFRQAVNPQTRVIEAINPSVLLKSRKNAQEAAQIRSAMEQDGAALCEFFSWFEDRLGKERLTELSIDEHITAARARQPHFVSASFATIAGFNPNGAMPHYRATEQSHAVIEGDGLLLIDSGGQYLNGTTDITRVVPVGTVSAGQKRDFTLVLQGMIALSRIQFPHGTYSTALDTVARAPMWAQGINYGHGTGHGVGYFLNVHEGPQSISSSAIPDRHMVMEQGMVTSNEPGIYRPGQWGIRIENLMLCIAAETTQFGDFLQFESLTLCPIDTRCIDFSLIREDELAWLNSYHATVRQRLASRLSGIALEWLEQRCLAVSR